MWKIQVKWQESGNLISTKILISESKEKVKAWGKTNKKRKKKFLCEKKAKKKAS